MNAFIHSVSNRDGAFLATAGVATGLVCGYAAAVLFRNTVGNIATMFYEATDEKKKTAGQWGEVLGSFAMLNIAHITTEKFDAPFLTCMKAGIIAAGVLKTAYDNTHNYKNFGIATVLGGLTSCAGSFVINPYLGLALGLGMTNHVSKTFKS